MDAFNNIPTVSVVMPAFNHELYIGLAIESVLKQDFKNFELIIINDGSFDNTHDVVMNYCDERIRYFCQENKGANEAINFGISVSRGEYIAIINSDDIFYVDRISKLIDTANATDSTKDTLFFTGLQIIDKCGNLLIDNQRAQFYKQLLSKTVGSRAADAMLVGNVAMTTSNFFFNKRLYQKIGPFSPLRYCHDWDWALRALTDGNCFWLGENLLSYRVHPTNTISEDDAWKHIQENAYIFSQFICRLLKSDVSQIDLNFIIRTFTALLQNESFLPVPVLILLIYSLHGANSDEIQTNMSNGNIKDALNSIQIHAQIPFEAMLSHKALKDCQHMVQVMDEMIRQRDETIASQGQLLEERWAAMQKMDEMIRQRDEVIATQRQVLENSISYKARKLKEGVLATFKKITRRLFF